MVRRRRIVAYLLRLYDVTSKGNGPNEACNSSSLRVTELLLVGRGRYEYWAAVSRFLDFWLRPPSKIRHYVLNGAVGRAVRSYQERASQHVAAQSSSQSAIPYADIMAILAGSLATSARQTLMILDTFRTRLEYHVLGDCCLHIRRTPFLWAEVSQSPELFRHFVRQVGHMRSTGSWPKDPLRFRYVNLMVEFSTSPEALEILSNFEAKYHDVSDAVLLRLVSHYTTLGEVDMALGALSRVSPTTFRSPRGSWLGRIVNLLALDTVQSSPSTSNFRILPKLLELGVPPIEIIQNMMVQNAVKSGKTQVAFDLLYYLRNEKITVSTWTYSKLLKHSFLARDTQRIDELFTIFHNDEVLRRDPWLIASIMNIVRSICYFEQRLGVVACVSRVMQVYDRSYSRVPLAKFGLQLGDAQPPTANQKDDLHPAVLGGVIWSYVLVQRDPMHVMHVWTCFTRLLEASDPLAARFAQEELGAFRSFLVFFSRQQHCSPDKLLMILRYMLSKYPKSLGEVEWALVFAGFIRAGHLEMAEKLRKLMLSTGRTFTSPGLEHMQERWGDLELVKKMLDNVDVRGMLPSSTKDVEVTMTEVFGPAVQVDTQASDFGPAFTDYGAFFTGAMRSEGFSG
jgi:hypothetical protein